MALQNSASSKSDRREEKGRGWFVYKSDALAAVHRLLAFMVEHLPSTLFLILTARSDPPLPLARLRLRAGLARPTAFPERAIATSSVPR